MEISIYDECLRKEERKTPCFCSPSVMPSILRQLDDKENMFPIGAMNIIPAPSPHAIALSEEKSRPALQDVSRFFASACSLEDTEQPEEEEEEEDNSNANNNTNNIQQNTISTNKPSNDTNKKVTVTKKKKKTHSSSTSSNGVSNNTAAASLLNSSNNNNNSLVPKRVTQLKKLR